MGAVGCECYWFGEGICDSGVGVQSAGCCDCLGVVGFGRLVCDVGGIGQGWMYDGVCDD